MDEEDTIREEFLKVLHSEKDASQFEFFIKGFEAGKRYEANARKK